MPPHEIPDDIVDEYWRAFGLVKKQRYQDAKPILKQCVDLYPQVLVSRKEYAYVLRKLGELDAALAERLAIKNLSPSDEMTRYEIITILQELNRNDEALEEAIELRQMRPWYIPYRIMVRNIRRALSARKAPSLPSGLLELIPVNASSRSQLIDLLSKKQYTEALTLAKSIVSQDPADEKACRLMAILRNLAHRGKIFITYQSGNANAARAVTEMLLRNNYDVWFAEYEVLSLNYDTFEAELDKNLKDALSKCRTAIVFASNQWAGSDFCKDEMEYISGNFDESRILQICVPKQDDRPIADWPILRDVPTFTCDFSNSTEVKTLYSWVLAQLRVESVDDYSSVLPVELGPVVDIADPYRGGSLARIRVGPFQSIKPSFWYHLTILADFIQLLRGWPSIAFEWSSGAPHRICQLIIDARVNRWTDDSLEYDLENTDDRKLYRHLQSIAKGGYERHSNLKEGGLHIFRSQNRGQLAITFRTPTILGHYYWKRIYVIAVQNRIDGTKGEVDMAFSCMFREEIPEDFSFREFCAFIPLFDGIAGSLEYEGYATENVLMKVRLWWAIAGSACLLICALVLKFLLSAPLGSIYFVGAAVVGAILGIALNHRLMVVPKRNC